MTPWLDAAELIPGYRRALHAGTDDGDVAVLIDNGSATALRTLWGDDGIPDWQRFVRNEQNLGFSRACNQGLAAAATDAVLFLNNDIRMTSSTWLEQIRQALKPGVLVGAQLRRDPHTAVDGRLIPYLDGWCLAGLTDEIRNLGGWNDTFEEPAYYGDNELCVRAVAAGMTLVEAPVGLRHLSNYTSRRMDVTGVSARNRDRYEQAVRDLLPAVAAA